MLSFSVSAFLYPWVCLTIFATVALSKSVEPPLSIAAFNVQNLGQAKLTNTAVMNTVTKIVLRYDLIFIQEIVTKVPRLMDNMLKKINKDAPTGIVYKMEISPRLGTTYAQEQYAYIYRTSKLSVLGAEVYPDSEIVPQFERPPFIVHFESPSTKDFTKFIAIGIHTQPRSAADEISALAGVYDYAKDKYKNENAILMGDMNAGCANVRVSDWETIDLWTRTEFQWLIDSDTDTTNAVSCCPYDRFIINGDEMKLGVIPELAKVFDFSKEYGLTDQQAARVSDHEVIEMKIRGKLSKVAKSSLSSNICVHVEDNRKLKLEENKLLSLGFVAFSDSDGSPVMWQYKSTSSTLEDHLTWLGTFFDRGMFPQEALDAILYKTQNGALDDRTSFTEQRNPEFTMSVNFQNKGGFEVFICQETGIN